MVFGTWSQAHAYNPSDYMETRLFWRSDYNWVVDRRNMPVEDLIRSQLQSGEEFIDQRSSHFKLCIAVNFK